MLVIKIHNDGTGDRHDANYDCEVLVTVSPTQLKTIARGRVEGFRRADGWRQLVKRVVEIGDFDYEEDA